METGLDLLAKVEKEVIPYRILYLVHDNKKGGAALSFLDMIKGVSKEHDVYVLTPHKNGYIPDELKKLGVWHRSAHYFWWEIAKIGNPVVDYLRFVLYKLLNAYNHIEARKLAKLVRKLNIDIIHSNSSVINIGALVSELTGIPYVWHLRELGYQDFSLLPVLRGDSLEREINRGNSTYIAISEYVAGYYSRYIIGENIINRTGHQMTVDESVTNAQEKNIHIIYNGISSSYNYKKSMDEYVPTGTVNFLISGNYCEEKGQIDVAHALVILVSHGVKGFKVYMAGQGDYAEVKKYLEEYNLTEYVVFCGLVDDMLDLRKKCDVEIVASRTEAFGRVTVEAMRASNPVIGSATGGTTELIQDGVTGFLYKYKDNKALAECMKKFIDSPELAYEIGQRAYKWSIGRFTSEENVKGVLEVYKGIISGDDQ